MIIDVHNHPDWHGHNFEKFVQNMADYDIDKTWLLTWEAPEDEYDPTYNYTAMRDHIRGPLPFERALRYKERAPDKFVLGYAPDPRRPDAIDQLRAAVEIHGVQVYGELKLRMMYDNPDALRMYRFCGEQGLPVTVHIDYEFDTGGKYPRPSWWYGGGIACFERAVAACPETNFIGHAPGFWAHISDLGEPAVMYPKGNVIPGGKVVTMLRQYPNLYADLSAGSGYNALARDPEFAKDFVREFQDRLLYGRDTFDNKLQAILNDLDLPDAVLEKIYARNARKLLGNI